MTFHSIVPPEALVPEEDVAPTQCHPCKYGFVQGQGDAMGMFVVNRVVSTDPTAYLDPLFIPGAIFPLTDLDPDPDKEDERLR